MNLMTLMSPKPVFKIKSKPQPPTKPLTSKKNTDTRKRTKTLNRTILKRPTEGPTEKNRFGRSLVQRVSWNCLKSQEKKNLQKASKPSKKKKGSPQLKKNTNKNGFTPALPRRLVGFLLRLLPTDELLEVHQATEGRSHGATAFLHLSGRF